MLQCLLWATWMHCSDLRLSLPCLPLIINPRQLLPFGLAIRPHAVTAKANGGEKKSKRLEEIGLRFLFIWGKRGAFFKYRGQAGIGHICLWKKGWKEGDREKKKEERTQERVREERDEWERWKEIHFSFLFEIFYWRWTSNVEILMWFSAQCHVIKGSVHPN